MNRHCRYPFGLVLVAISLIAASSVPTEPPPAFLTKWGSFCDTSASGVDGCDGRFGNPRGMAVDASGNIYVADHWNHRIQKFDRAGTFLAKWGTHCKTSVSGVDGCDGHFFFSMTVALNAAGDVYVADLNHRIQKFDKDGIFQSKWGSNGAGAGQFYSPYGLAVDATGNVYVADTYNYRVQKFDSNGAFLLMWGWGVKDGASELQVCTSACRAGIQGNGNGQFDRPAEVAVDATGDVYLAGAYNHRIQKFDSGGTFLAKWGGYGTGDGQFNYASSVAVSTEGDVYVTDMGNHRIQKFDNSGMLLCVWGSEGTSNGQFDSPWGVALSKTSDIYVAEYSNHRLQHFGGPWLDVFIGEPELQDGR